jgi:hypothetical protein
MIVSVAAGTTRQRRDLELIAAAAQMSVCTECGDLSGAFVDARYGDVLRLQRCTCPSRRVTLGEPRWGLRDFNRAAELCWCCAAVLIESGSRWSRLFCGACQADVHASNASGGSYIPIARDSIANGITRWKLDDFYTRLQSLTDWRAARVRALMRWTSCSQRVPAYIAAATSPSARTEAFVGLSESFAKLSRTE